MLDSCWASSFITQEIVNADNINNHELFVVTKDSWSNVLQQIATLAKLSPGRNQRPHGVTLAAARLFGNLVTGTNKMTSYIINEIHILLIIGDYLVTVFNSKTTIIFWNKYMCWSFTQHMYAAQTIIVSFCKRMA